MQRVARELGREQQLRCFRCLAEAQPSPGLWVLDMNLPDGSGVDWARTLRAAGHAGPVILISHSQLPPEVDLNPLQPCSFARKPQGLEQLKSWMRLWWP